MPKSSEMEIAIPVVRRIGWKRWLFGLWTAFLITAAIAVWVNVYVIRRENAMLESRIAAILPTSRELVVDDPKQFAVVKLDELWKDDTRWDVHLPLGDYRLCLATSTIDEKGLAPVVKTAPLTAGRHRLILDQVREGPSRRILVAGDGLELLETAVSQEWDTDRNTLTSGPVGPSTQSPADRPLVLFRRRIFSMRAHPQPPVMTGPADGVLLWIERADRLEGDDRGSSGAPGLP